jgi:type II secretion system protein H
MRPLKRNVLKRCSVEPLQPSRAFHRSTRSAFTLIELILIMALLVIITSVALPTMSKFVRGRALDSEARRLMSLMHAAQSRAVSEGMPMMLWIDEKTGAYGMEAETSGQNGDPKAEELMADSVLKIGVLNAGTGAQTTFNNLPAIKFLPDATVDETSPQTVALQDVDGFSRLLVLNKLRTGYEVTDASGK